MINTKLQNIIDTKAAIGNAIVNKGGTITSSTPFYNYAAEIDNLETGGGGGLVTFGGWAIQDVNGVKYETYNGYDYVTNPTPNPNDYLDFNFWRINNNTTRELISNDAIMLTTTRNFAGEGTISLNIANMSPIIIKNTFSEVGGRIKSIAFDNGFLYLAANNSSPTDRSIAKYDSNLNFIEKGPPINNIALTASLFEFLKIKEDFIYVSTSFEPRIFKIHKGNLTFATSSVNHFGNIWSFDLDSNYVYLGHGNNLKRYWKDNLINTGLATPTGLPNITRVIVDNDHLYVYHNGTSNVTTTIRKYNKENFELLQSINEWWTPNSASGNMTLEGDFIYAITATQLHKLYKENLTVVANVSSSFGIAPRVWYNNNFIYTSNNGAATIRRYHASNLVFVNSAVYAGLASNGPYMTFGNNKIYVMGVYSSNNVSMLTEAGGAGDTVSLFSVNKIRGV
jgi:hypothetical protein